MRGEETMSKAEVVKRIHNIFYVDINKQHKVIKEMMDSHYEGHVMQPDRVGDITIQQLDYYVSNMTRYLMDLQNELNKYRRETE